MKPAWIRAAEYGGIDPDPRQQILMERFGHWLATEGVRGGGIGPSEPERIDRRHLADSVLFASQLDPATLEVWDLGSGVGLPGIPLAILHPETEFHLLDRSGRRVDLLRRATRVLQLDNCQVIHGEIENLSGEVDVIVARAILPPVELLPVAGRHLKPGGLAVVGGSWVQRPAHSGWSTIEIPRHVLDHPVWLLIMRRE
ncbi:MAG TPA: RsmG family class I SAM-dependent methyltransferase [Acidimicrobiia bacterium]|nr:RsmG family class I SAM-dependent methyltransferase [Acidimicrobiia bacterium]